jgi:hypothetical protein
LPLIHHGLWDACVQSAFLLLAWFQEIGDAEAIALKLPKSSHQVGLRQSNRNGESNMTSVAYPSREFHKDSLYHLPPANYIVATWLALGRRSLDQKRHLETEEIFGIDRDSFSSHQT